ncbi:ATP-binding protein [Streptomyces tropicalis]|uniref:AAA family ATPase n=1 Tax=Streptomyces tropicalis TaxID=3034234 RepID=A0ABT6A4Y3_9ACTN|nr:AAA family ATPase [Streptomyces tropicalis]MDF3299709.1 AAA family ATPase [Streptomyces tropicalis]
MGGSQRRAGLAGGGLPAEVDRFVGRRAEMAGLAAALGAARLVTVTGAGGVGKSRLAARAAARSSARDGVWRVDLAAVRDAELADHALAEALGLSDHTARPPRETLLEHLAGCELLLVLDGFEHLVDACAALVAALLRRAPGLRVLAVGRRPLGVSGERLFRLGPLAEDEAVRLFTDRAAQHGQPVVPGGEADVRELCRRLDGIPLAIELAAGRLRALSPAQLLERLGDRFRLLSGGARDALPRHRTLRLAIGWSHELCTPAERLLWARLSVFAGPFGLEAAEYVCSGGGLPAGEVLDVLSELLAQSVVTREESATGVRYRMLDTVRAYGACWLDAVGDTDRLRRRHRDWYVGLATACELDWFSPRQAEVAARTGAELPNLRCALEYGLAGPDETHLGQYLAGCLWFYWAGCGRLAEGRHWLARAVAVDGGHERSRLKALWVLAYVAILQGDTVPALAALQECRETAQRAASATAMAYAEHRAGCLALVTDDMERAELLLRSALGRYQEIGELNSNVLMAQVELAMTRAFRGDLPDAVRMCEDVRRVCDDHGERWTRAYALYVLAYAAWRDGRAGAARDLLTDCLSSAHAFGDLLGSVLAVELLALVRAAQGDAAEAAVLQGAAGGMWPAVGLRLFGSAYFNAPHELCAATARAQLGDARYEECRRVGARLGREAAVARALGRPGARSLEGLPAQRGPGSREEDAAGTHEPAASRVRKDGETAG